MNREFAAAALWLRQARRSAQRVLCALTGEADAESGWR